MMAAYDMTPAEMTMLRNVVDIYVDSGRPVSSRTIKSVCGLDISTANIRSILHRLEEKGLLYKPHVSAGRMPSDLGYRTYVDGIEKYGPLSRRMLEEIRRRIGRDSTDVRDVMSRTSRLLADLTDYMGLIMGVFYSGSTVGRLRIVQGEGNRAIVVITLLPGIERHIPVEFPKRYPAYIVDRAAQMINERIVGFPLESASFHIEAFLRDGWGVEWEIARAVATEVDDLLGDEYNITYAFRGNERALAFPELSDTKVLRNLVRIMGERSLMLRVMKNRMEHECLVTIGRENELEELEDFSVITHRFTAGECEGLLGILGPTRMSYRLVLSILRKMAEELHRAK